MTRASQHLYVSQSTLSQRLRSLENRLGVQLIRRGKGIKNIELTTYGKKFLYLALEYEELNHKAKDLKSLQKRESLIIGAVDSVHNFNFIPHYEKIKKEEQHIKFILRTHQSNEIYFLLEQREIDVGFPLQERVMKDFIVREYFTEDMVLIKKAFGRKPEQIYNSDLKPEYELYINWGAEFRTWHEKWWGIRGTEGLQVDTGSLLLQLMTHPGNWAIIPESMALEFIKTKKIDIFPLFDKPPSRTCYIVYNKNSDKRTIIESIFLNKNNK